MWKFLNLLGLQWRSCKRVAHGAAFSLSVMQPDWNFYNNQVHNRPRDWRVSANFGAQFRAPSDQSYHTNMISNDSKEPLIRILVGIPRSVSFSEADERS